MKKLYLFITCLLGCLCAPVTAYAGDDETKEDSIFVEKNDGSLDIFPASAVVEETIDEAYLKVVTLGGSEFLYRLDDLKSYDHQMLLNRPTLTSFKFNNKFNHQLFTDVLCEITADNKIVNMEGYPVRAFAHWLTPSFKRSDARAEVYLDDETPLVSKVSRVKMGDKHRVTVAYPGVRIVRNTLVSPAEEGKEEWQQTEIPLTADMLSTNAPSNYPDQDLDMAVDGNPSTFFHSTWGSGSYVPLDLSDFPYIDVRLPEPVYNISYAITNRADNDRSPVILSLWVSYDDGASWQEVQRNLDGDLDTSRGATNTSPFVELEKPASLFRIEQLKATYKNYFCVAELKMFTGEKVQTQGKPAVYADTMVPYGTEYQLNLTWAQATGVPKVYINVANGAYVSSKTDYLNATIRLDGAGIYPDFAATAVKIRGRGNSSWSTTAWSKNPYRLKFEEKKKPFGLKNAKSWILLANRQSGSMTSNAIGMYAAGLIGADGANHIVPVELYMNGEYWGSYNFTEKTGFSNNSIDLDDETKACFLELDTYSDETRYWSYAEIYDEYNYSYKSVGIPVKIKEPETFNPYQEAPKINKDTTLIRSYRDIMDRFDAFTAAVQNQEDISSVVDVESMARFLVTNELIINYELMHPKSTFLYHENVYDPESKFKWGPVWDLDWSYGYEYGSRTYFQSGATDRYFTRASMEASAFWKQLRQCGEPLDRAMYKYWSRFIRLYLNELIDYCDDYYAFAKSSLEHNNSHVNYSDKDYTDYATTTANSKRWLQQRATAVYKQLTPYELTEEEIMGIPETPEDQPGDEPYFTDGIAAPATGTFFEVYDMRGVRLKQRASYNTWRNGLAPGIYIVNGKKVLVK